MDDNQIFVCMGMNGCIFYISLCACVSENGDCVLIGMVDSAFFRRILFIPFEFVNIP